MWKDFGFNESHYRCKSDSEHPSSDHADAVLREWRESAFTGKNTSTRFVSCSIP